MDWAYSDQDEFQDSDHSQLSNENSQEQHKHPMQLQKDSELENSNQKVTSQQIFELTEQNISCQICWKYALNAVICLNEKCKKLFCLSCVNSTKNNLQNKCPFCRTEPFEFHPSTYAKIINKMDLVCLLCKQKYVLQQEQKHYKLNCSFFQKIQCKYCKEKFLNNQIVQHTKQFHAKQIDEIIYSFYNNPSPQPNVKELLERHKLYFEKIDRRPQLGTSGKFYCGGKLQTKCTCCNGYCGPTNGENCVECMKLDLKKFGLPKGYLVNSVGIVCYKSGSDFVCGVKLHYQQGKCSEGSTCRPCTNMKKNIKRYQDLI